jgi:hypothetical protein
MSPDTPGLSPEAASAAYEPMVRHPLEAGLVALPWDYPWSSCQANALIRPGLCCGFAGGSNDRPPEGRLTIQMP